MLYRECLSYDDILLVPRFSELQSRAEANPSWKGYSLPIATAPMDLITTPQMVKYFYDNNLMVNIHRYFKSVNNQISFINECSELVGIDRSKLLEKVYVAVGTIRKYRNWIYDLHMIGTECYLVDLAHGDCQLCIDTIKYIKSINSRNKVIAGNVATKSAFDRLQRAGADAIRCGIGGGSCCSTRTRTAFGVPTLTTIMDCAPIKNDNVLLIACGGIKNTGDIVKAMAAGADIVLLGKLLAETDLAGGQCYNKEKTLCAEDEIPAYKEYYGMASKRAREGVLSYNSIEGSAGLVEYTGTTDQIVTDIRLNIQAALSYAGVNNWQDFKKYVKIIKVSSSSYEEGKSHLIN